MTEKDRVTLRLMCECAVAWERTLIRSLSAGSDPSDVRAAQDAAKNIEAFRKLTAKLQESTDVR